MPRIQSATMISLADRCLRHAGFKYFSDYPKEPRPDQDDGRSLGQLLHEAQETYAQTGQSPPPGDEVGDMFRASLPLIPAPKIGLSEARREFKLGGVEYLVLLDWQGKAGDLPRLDLPGVKPEDPAILDFKTSKDPKKHGIGLNPDKPPHQDIQAILYGTYKLAQDKGAKNVAARWLYLKTEVKRKVPMPVDFSFSRGQCQDLFNERIYPTSLLLQKVEKEKISPHDLDPNPDACEDYRGCWYAERNGGPCRLTEAQKRERYMDMGALDNILKGKSVDGAEAAPSGSPLTEMFRTKEAGEPFKAEPGQETGSIAYSAKGRDPGINPPDEIEDVPEDLKPEEKKPAATKKRTAKKKSEPVDETAVIRGAQLAAKLVFDRDLSADDAKALVEFVKAVKS